MTDDQQLLIKSELQGIQVIYFVQSHCHKSRRRQQTHEPGTEAESGSRTKSPQTKSP